MTRRRNQGAEHALQFARSMSAPTTTLRPPITVRLEPWRPRAARTTTRTSGLARTAAGLALVLHGLVHAVLPARGAGMVEETELERLVMHVASTLAIVGFVAAGVGLLGARPFRLLVRALIYVAVIASALAIIAFDATDLYAGLVLDLVVLVLVRRRIDVVPVAGGPVSRARRVFSLVGDAVAMAFVAHVLLTAGTRPWRYRWGVRDAELTKALPGDTPNRDPANECMHAISINAPPEAVWPWLVQIGQDRGGFYSYELFENAFLLRIRNADTIHPEWQEREVGDLVRAAPPDWFGGVFGSDVGWRVSHVEPNRALVLRWWGAFVIEREPDGTSRLIVRSKMGDPRYPVWAIVPSFVLFDLPHFIMERRMLLGIRDRVERQQP